MDLVKVNEGTFQAGVFIFLANIYLKLVHGIDPGLLASTALMVVTVVWFITLFAYLFEEK